MSAVFFQDTFGLITFDDGFHAAAARCGRASARARSIHCLDAYQHGHGLQDVKHAGSLSATLDRLHRARPSLMPVISDFLFDDAPDVLQRAARSSNTVHDVFLVIVDARSPSSCRACRPAGSRRTTSRPAARA